MFMKELKILKIWRSLSKTQKAVLYAYLSFCDDIPLSIRFYKRNKPLGADCDSTKFISKVEELEYAQYRHEVWKILKSVCNTGLMTWHDPTKKHIFKRRIRQGRYQRFISKEVYRFVLFSDFLEAEDLKLRDIFFSNWQLAYLSVILNMPEEFIINCVHNAGDSKSELSKLFNIAVCNSSVSLLKKLYNMGAELKPNEKYDWHPLMIAAYFHNDTKLIDFLLEKGAPITMHNEYERNLLHFAAENPNSNILAYILQLVPKEYIEEKEARNKHTPLTLAYLAGIRKNMRLLIKAGANKENAKPKQDQMYTPPDFDQETENDLVFARWRHDNFEWTPENTQRIIKVINGIDAKLNQMYDTVLKIKHFMDSQTIPDAIKKDYWIEADLIYSNDENSIPTADKKTIHMLWNQTDWNLMPSITANSKGMRTRSDNLYLDMNWDVETFDRTELEHIKIPYYIHMLFVDSHTYTLNDMMYMNPDDFKIGIEVTFNGDDL